MKNFISMIAVGLLPLLPCLPCRAGERSASPADTTAEIPRPAVDAPFEGVLSLITVNSRPGRGKLKLFIGKKGGRAESSLSVEGASGTLKTTVISPAETPDRVYIIDGVSGACMALDIQRSIQAEVADPFRNAKIENLGSQAVNGYPCNHLRISVPGSAETIELWVTKGLLDYSTFIRMQGSRNPALLQLADRLRDEGFDGFPARIRFRPSGVVTELISVYRTALDDALFSVPENCMKLPLLPGSKATGGAQSKEMRAPSRRLPQQVQTP